MSGITLTILGDAAGVKRAFGQVVSAQRSANTALSAEDRAVNERRRKGYDADAAAAAKAEKEKTRAERREAAERAREAKAAEREKKKLADRAARDARGLAGHARAPPGHGGACAASSTARPLASRAPRRAPAS